MDIKTLFTEMKATGASVQTFVFGSADDVEDYAVILVCGEQEVSEILKAVKAVEDGWDRGEVVSQADAAKAIAKATGKGDKQ